MVFIPWEKMGICKFWMVRRCASGEKCKWGHPEPRERQRLWDYHTEQQKLDEERGIPPPTAPPKRYDPTKLSESGPTNPRPTPSPPPPPPPPPNSPTRPRNCYRIESSPASSFPPRTGELQAVNLTPGNSSSRNIDHSRDPRLAGRKKQPETIEASLQNMPSPPQHDEQPRNSFKSIVNAEAPGTSSRRTRWDSKTTIYKHDEDAIESAFCADVPSGAAVTLWKRGKAADDAHMTAIKEPSHNSGYWQRFRGFNADVGVKKDADNADAEEGAFGGAEAIKSWDKPHLIQPQNQTSDIPIASSSPIDVTNKLIMGATKRLSNGETKHVGPHPSTIRVSAQYISQAAISKKLEQATSQGHLDIQERSIAEAREDSIRLQGVGWIDNVRRSLQLPIRTYTTACVYFHKLRLAHAGGANGMEYNHAWPDACAASLLTSCKVEDTLKKSRDILAAAYNIKATTHDQLGSDDSVFEGPSRVVIGLERLVLEAGGFDFRSKYPHRLLVKMAKSMPEGTDGEREKVAKISWTVLTDLYRTVAPLKQTSATMALASLELAAHLVAASSINNVSAVRDALQQVDLKVWATTREEIMETLLDLLDLYTQHTQHTILGSKYSLDDFLRIRLALNKECNEANIPRYTTAPPSDRAANGSTLRVANGHPTPVSPMEPGPQAQPQTQNTSSNQASPEGVGTLRFMLDPQLATDEKAQVQKYFTEEWEEYEEEVEVAQPRQQSREREREADSNRSSSIQARTLPARAERSERDGARSREGSERERVERERARVRDAERERRYGDRRYEDRDRRERRFEGRRYEDDRRRRDERW